MKKLIVFLVPILVIFACKKAIVNQPEQVTHRATGGWLPDDPSRSSLIASSEFLKGKAPIIQSGISDLAQLAKGKPDNVPPTVAITYPTQGQVLDTGMVIVTVSASDNVAVKSVILRVNGVRIDSLLAAPYNFSWRNTSLAGTSPTLLATARDAAGNWSSYSITVVVNPVPPPPPPPSYTGMVTPVPANQGNEGSCSAFTVANGFDIENYYRTGTMTLFSQEWLYDIAKAAGDCGAGSNVTGNLDVIYNYGAVTSATLPYSDMNGCSVTITSELLAEAAQHKIPTYNHITNTDRIAIKNMVVAHHPVMTGINIDNNFLNAQPGYTWNTIGSGNAPHAVVVIGYDDSRNAYLIMNSFGTSWGDGGFLWVDYSVYETRAGFYSYVMNY